MSYSLFLTEVYLNFVISLFYPIYWVNFESAYHIDCAIQSWAVFLIIIVNVIIVLSFLQIDHIWFCSNLFLCDVCVCLCVESNLRSGQWFPAGKLLWLPPFPLVQFSTNNTTTPHRIQLLSSIRAQPRSSKHPLMISCHQHNLMHSLFPLNPQTDFQLLTNSTNLLWI